MMKRSFAEIDAARNEDIRTMQLKELKEKLAFVEPLQCSKCVLNIEEYYEKCSQISQLHNAMQVS